MNSFRHKKAKDITKLSSYLQNANFDETTIQKNLKWEILNEIKQKKPGMHIIQCRTAILNLFFIFYTFWKVITQFTSKKADSQIYFRN